MNVKQMWSNPELRSSRIIILVPCLSPSIPYLILALDQLASNPEYYKSSNNIGYDKQQVQPFLFNVFAMLGKMPAKSCYISNLIK